MKCHHGNTFLLQVVGLGFFMRNWIVSECAMSDWWKVIWITIECEVINGPMQKLVIKALSRLLPLELHDECKNMQIEYFGVYIHDGITHDYK